VDVVVTGRHTEVPEKFRQTVQDKLAKIPSLAPKAHRIDVELSHERNPRQASSSERVEITVRGKGPVVRAEAASEDAGAAFDIAFGKLLERLRRSRDRVKVHHGRQTPASLRSADSLNGSADGNGSANGNGAAPESGDAGLDSGDDSTGLADSPIVIRTKDHPATPMSIEQALTAMELVGHDFYLFVDAECGRPSAVYRRQGWTYGVIRLVLDDAAPGPEVAAGTQA
jgi:ribosomal subunit interface protein